MSRLPNPPPSLEYNALLAGRVAIVTGGGAGIGGSISRLNTAHGALSTGHSLRSILH